MNVSNQEYVPKKEALIDLSVMDHRSLGSKTQMKTAHTANSTQRDIGKFIRKRKTGNKSVLNGSDIDGPRPDSLSIDSHNIDAEPPKYEKCVVLPDSFLSSQKKP